MELFVSPLETVCSILMKLLLCQGFDLDTGSATRCGRCGSKKVKKRICHGYLPHI